MRTIRRPSCYRAAQEFRFQETIVCGTIEHIIDTTWQDIDIPARGFLATGARGAAVWLRVLVL